MGTLSWPHRHGARGSSAFLNTIPKGFRGRIEWSSVDNRFYHRLLYALMVEEARAHRFGRALALARKQLRLNPRDNLGIRGWIDTLEAAKDDPSVVLDALASGSY